MTKRIKIVNAFDADGKYNNGDVLEVDASRTPHTIHPKGSVYVEGISVVIYPDEFEYVEEEENPASLDVIEGYLEGTIVFSPGAVAEVAADSEDVVNQPSHYKQGGVETIVYIQQVTAGYKDPFVSHCAGTATKYIARAPFKHSDPLQDLQKARRYLDFAIRHIEGRPLNDEEA